MVALALAGYLLNPFAFADTTIAVTNSADAGPGTLRQTIADSAPGDTITFALTDTNTIALTNGALLITNVLTIVSTNGTVAIDAGGLSRVLEIAASNIVTLDSLIITNGIAPDNGGGILVDDGATLMLTNCTVAGNFADAGGGIFLSPNSGVAINNSIFTANSATNNGGAIAEETGGAITVSDSVFSGNSALRGGAIFNNFGTNILNNCSFFSNSAEDGGAIANFDSTLAATGLSASNNFAAAGGAIFNQNNSAILLLDHSILSTNFATNYGGAIINTNGGTAAIYDCTIATNSCPKDQGGGIDNWAALRVNRCTVAYNNPGGGVVNVGGSVVCNNSTIAGNFAMFDGGGYYSAAGTNTLNNCTLCGNVSGRRGGGLIADNVSPCFVTNTIIAGNSAGTFGPDVFGEISDANNLTNGDPVLSPLGDYGGPTQTMPPLFGSPAINAGVDSVTNLLTTDQRGYARRVGAHVDIGAVEIQPAMVVNTNDDGPGSLRAVASSALVVIVFTNTLSGQTIHLTSGQLTLSNSVDIDASSLADGVLIDAGGNSRVLEITSSNTVTLDSLTLTKGNVSENGGGILVDDSAMLILANCTVAGNLAASGGGIFLATSSTAVVTNSVFASNSATNNGGAIAGDTNSVLTVNNSAFSGNSANSAGAVFDNFATNALSNCSFFSNSAEDGGAIANFDSLLTATILNVSNNFAAVGGGILLSTKSTAAINNSIFIANSATNNGGAIANDTSSVLTVSDSAFSANSANSGGAIFNNFGSDMLSNCSFFSNSAENGGAIANFDSLLSASSLSLSNNLAGVGGGILLSTNSEAGINNSIFTGNSATNNGGAIASDIDSMLTVKSSAFSANSASNGGAIFNNFGSNTFNSCAFSNNASIADTGGGICNAGSLVINTCILDGNNPGGGIAQISGILTVNNSTVSRNTALQNGGGFDIAGGQSTLNNCTLYGNSSSNGGGMAIDVGVTNRLSNCTISGNSANTGGGLYETASSSSISLLTNTIVAGNIATGGVDISGLVSGANNIVNGGNPLLAPFGDYGGPTPTMPPLAGSAAIDAGLDAAAASLITDQRGYPRKSGPHADIGAVEAQLAPPNPRPVLRLSRQPGVLTFTFTNLSNADFTALSSTNLGLPLRQWNVLGPAIQNPPGIYQFSDPAPTNSRVRFYQVVSP